MTTPDESPRSTDERFYTPRASARTGGTGYSSGDDKFYTPRTGLTARSADDYYTPRAAEYDNSSSSDTEREEFYSSRDHHSDGVPALPMPFAYGGVSAASGVGPPGHSRSHSGGVVGVPPAYPRSTSGGRRLSRGSTPAALAGAGATAHYTIDGVAPVAAHMPAVASFTVPSPRGAATASPGSYSHPAYPSVAAAAAAEEAAYAVPRESDSAKGAGAGVGVYDHNPHYAYTRGSGSGGKVAEAPAAVGAGAGGYEAKAADVEAGARHSDYAVGPDTTSSAAGISEQDIQDVWSLTRHNRYKEVAALLEKGLPVNVRDKFGNTILATACQNGLKRIAKIALRSGADINARNHKGNTPLHFCFAYGYGDTLGEYLISKGADCTIRNNDGMTCREGIITGRTPRR